MGNTSNKLVGYARGWNEDRHIKVTPDVVYEATQQLRTVLFQDHAIFALKNWLQALSADDNGAMFGTLCFAGQAGTGQSRCVKVIARAFWGRGAKITDIDMRQFSHAHHVLDFMSQLQAAHGSNVVTFSHLPRAHRAVLAVVDQVVRTRKLTCTKFDGQHELLPGDVDFAHVMFIALNFMPLNGMKLSVHQIILKTKKTFSVLHSASFAKIFDAYVPFQELDGMAKKIVIQHELQRFGRDDSEESVEEVMRGVCDAGGFKCSVHRFLEQSGEVQEAEASSSTGPVSHKRGYESDEDGYPLLARQPVHTFKKPKMQPTIQHSYNTTTTTSDSHNPNTTTDSNNNTTSHSHNPAVTEGANGNENMLRSFNKKSVIPIAPHMNFTNAKYRAKSAKESENAEERIKNQPFPIRKNINVKPFVDGQDYFAELYQALKEAKQEILICGWQLAGIHLLRPTTSRNNDSNIFMLLGQAANRGVDIYVMLRNHDNTVVANNHNQIKTTLQMLHNKIKVSLQARGNAYVSLWSHHQKFVVIDGKLAYVGGLDLTFYRWDTPEHKIVEDESMIPDDDYYNNGFTGKTVRTHHPRMGWHDVQVSVDGEIATDLRKSFCDRWNATEVNSPVPRTLQLGTFERNPGTADVQVVRSISGLKEGVKEINIAHSYCAVIATAPSFVYIENQYFITNPAIEDAIVLRIKQAHMNNETFGIMVVLPMAPDNNTGGFFGPRVMESIITQQCDSILNIQRRLEDDNIEASDYIHFYGLFAHGEMNGQTVGAQIYVHSKVMISDTTAVVGSANINFRSCDGDRDSEIAVVIQDPMFCDRLAKQLISEHCGQPVGEKGNAAFISSTVVETAKRNTDLFVRKFGSLQTVCNPSKVEDTHARNTTQELSGISGHIVKFPVKTPKKSSKFLDKLNFVTHATK